MNVITDVWRQLVQRRLWPVALLLVAALVAVPLTLAKSPAPAPPVPVAAAAAKGDDSTASFVSVAETNGTTERRRVLGMSKDPFAPAPLPKVKKRAKVSRAADVTPTPTATPDSTGPSGGSTAPPSSSPPSAAPTPAVPTVTLPKGSLKLRFGDTSSDSSTTELPTLFVNRLDPVPNTTTPVLMFEGTRDNGRTALFSIPGEVTAVGDGSCHPSPQDCETLKLRAGQTEFITVKGAGDNGADAEYELDLVKVFEKPTKLPKSEVESASGATP